MGSTSKLIRIKLLNLILLSKGKLLRWRWIWISWRKLKIFRISKRNSLLAKDRLLVTDHFEVFIGVNWYQRWWKIWVFLQNNSKDPEKCQRKGKKVCYLPSWRERKLWILMILRTNKKRIFTLRWKTCSTN